jgi:hypothetical protein
MYLVRYAGSGPQLPHRSRGVYQCFLAALNHTVVSCRNGGTGKRNSSVLRRWRDTIMQTRFLVGGIAYRVNAIRTTVRSHAEPAKLVFAAARHVVTPFVLFHTILTTGTLFELLGPILQ